GWWRRPERAHISGCGWRSDHSGMLAHMRAAAIGLLITSAVYAQGGAGVTAHPDLVYGRAGEKELMLDLYVPAGGKAPLVVWIHGGAWRQGSRRNPQAMYLTERGYAVASIGYRLSQEAIFPAQIHDCKAAIRWLRANAARYGYDASRIGAWGPSAGGHLAALLGTSGGVKELEGDGGNASQSSRVQAVVDFFGPTDLPAMARFPSNLDHAAADSPESQLIGGKVGDSLEKAALANPIRYITKDDPPFLILHGDKDMTVPINQSELLEKALREAGVPVTYRVMQGAGHGGPAFTAPEVREQVASFFDEHIRRGVGASLPGGGASEKRAR
ncbi:MAG TPA: alpha/beta hydrolase, partial [Beijerinckiaceae bacterium]|nr:alpha/beta hydrolase [Beijerinckiaceae bacterium]